MAVQNINGDFKQRSEQRGLAVMPWTGLDPRNVANTPDGSVPYGARPNAAPQGQTAPAAPAAPLSPEDEIMQRIKAFLDMMNAPLDMNDPYVKSVLQGTTNAASSDARLRGVGGPMSVANTQGHVANALTGLDMQRKGMVMQGLGMGSGHSLGMGNLGVARDRLGFDQDRFKYETDLQAWQNTPNAGRDWGSAIGTGLGALGYLIPGVGGSLMQPGAQIGAGLGGMINPGPPPPRYTPSRGYGGY